MSSSLRGFSAASAATLLLLSLSSAPGLATPSGPVLTLHARPATAKSDPCVDVPTAPCSQYNLDVPLGASTQVYVVAAGLSAAEGVQSASFQVLYDNQPGSGIDIYDWRLCADLEFPVSNYLGPWPGSGSGNRVTWGAANCALPEIPPDGVHAVAGVLYVYAYSEDFLSLVGPGIPGFSAPQVTTCTGAIHELPSSQTAMLRAGGTGSACNPCLGPCLEVDFLPCLVSTGQIDFGEVALGSSADRTFTVTNISSPSLNVSVPESCAEFEIVDPSLPVTLAYGESGAITVRFTPAAIGERFCVLYPCAFSLFATGTGVEDVSVERRTWGRIKTSYRP